MYPIALYIDVRRARIEWASPGGVDATVKHSQLPIH
jgi:hypothetical protein